MSGLHFRPDSIEQLPIEALRPYAHNPRTHSDAQVAKLAASLALYGWTIPVLIDDDREIIAGHGRLLAARLLGLDTVPVIRLKHLTPEQARAYRIDDNQLALEAGWDQALLSAELRELQVDGYDVQSMAFDQDALDALLTPIGDGSGMTDPEEAPEPPAEPVSRPGDLWVLGVHRLLCGDSTRADDVKRLMQGKRAILFATDPPYFVDYDGTNHPVKNAVTWNDASEGVDLYEGFMRAAIDEAIMPNAAWYCWHANRKQALIEGLWEKLGVLLHQQIVWVKNHPVLVRMHYMWAHEPCFYGWIKGHQPPRLSSSTGRPTTVWYMKSLDGKERPDHPTPKPLDCFAIPMREHVAPGGLCYEPFSGSGSQIMAGEVNGRRVFAMEVSPVYVNVAVRRWQAFTGIDATLDDDGRTFAAITAERLPQAV